MQIYEDKKMVTYIVLSLLCMSFGSTGCKISVSSSYSVWIVFFVEALFLHISSLFLFRCSFLSPPSPIRKRAER